MEVDKQKRPKYGGRVKGTPNKATADVKAVAGQYTQEAIEALVTIFRTSENDSAKVAAIKEILDRAHGKARQAVDMDANLNGQVVTRIELVSVPSDNR